MSTKGVGKPRASADQIGQPRAARNGGFVELQDAGLSREFRFQNIPDTYSRIVEVSLKGVTQYLERSPNAYDCFGRRVLRNDVSLADTNTCGCYNTLSPQR